MEKKIDSVNRNRNRSNPSVARSALLIGLTAISLTSWSSAASTAATCGDGLGFQVLGSGGPTANKERASSSYLVWINGKSRILLDAGGGSYARFGSSDARLEDLHLIGLSHLHADHSSDLPAYIKGGYFTERNNPLLIAGPSGAAPFPGIKAFMQRLFNAESGAFGYLSGTLDGSGGISETQVIEVNVEDRTKRQIHAEQDLVVYAQGVPHGPVPSIAFRVETPDYTIVYGADQNGDDPQFIKFARGADLLVMHLAIPEDAGQVARKLHAKPSDIARIANESRAKHVLLSHIMPRSDARLEHWKSEIESRIKAPVSVADDLMCVSREGSSTRKRDS